MVPAGPPGDAHQRPPGVHVPVGGPQAREGGDQVDAPRVGDLGGVVLRVPGLADEAQLIPHPLDHRAAHKDGTLQGVLHLPVQPHGDGGEQAVPAAAQLVPRVHQQETAGAVGVFGLPRGEAALAEQGGLLVPGHPGDGDLRPQQIGGPIDLAGVPHLGQHFRGDAQFGTDVLVPAQPPDIKEHGAAGVGHVGDVDRPAGELPHQPGVHRAEEQLAPLRLLTGALYMVQNPLELGGGEVGVNEQSGVLLHIGGERPVGLQLLAQGGGAAALPHDGVGDGPAGLPVPDDGGLPLVGDADGGQLLRGHPGLGQHLRQDGILGGPDLHGVLLHPAGLGIDLGELPLGGADDVLLPVKEDAPAAGGPLVQGGDIALHGRHLPFVFYYDRNRGGCQNHGFFRRGISPPRRRAGFRPAGRVSFPTMGKKPKDRRGRGRWTTAPLRFA